MKKTKKPLNKRIILRAHWSAQGKPCSPDNGKFAQLMCEGDSQLA